MGRSASDSRTDDHKPIALHRLFERVGELSSLPVVAQRVIAVANDPRSDVEDMRRVIETDASLIVRLLRRVNSSHYGLRHHVSDLRTALNMLGLREIRNLALNIFVAKLFRTPGNHGHYSREGLWRHAQAVGVAAQMISKVTRCAVPDEAYVAGLVHDMGYILIDQHLREHFCHIIDRLEPDIPTPATERAVLPFDHTQLGAFVAQHWNLSPAIIDVIHYHHRPEDYDGEHVELLYVVCLANFLCSRAGWSALGLHNLPSPPDQVYSGIQMTRTSLAVVWGELDGMLASKEFLHLY